MQELLPRQTPEPAGGQATDVLPRLRLALRSPPFFLALIVSAASGLLLSLALPPADLGPVAFVALVPLIWVARRLRPLPAIAAGAVFGLAYFGAVLSWLDLFGWIAWVPAVVVECLFTALFALLVSILWRPGKPIRSAGLTAGAWVAAEFCRAIWPLGGLTWGGLGYTQHANPLLLPLASVTGVWGIAFVVMFANAAIVAVVERLAGGAPVGEGSRRVRAVAPALAVTVVLALAPAAIPIPFSSWGPPQRDVAIVQGNVPAGAFPDRYLEDIAVAENHARLHATMAGNPPDLAVWPENALDQDPTRDPVTGNLVRTAVSEVGAPTLIGAITDAPGGRYLNENLLVYPALQVVARYAKLHLVPFGEYVPWRRYLGFITTLRQVPRDLAPGSGPVVFHIYTSKLPGSGFHFASVICFENAFGNLTREAVDQGAGFLVVSTNNASFLRTPLSRQHLVMSQLRAVENGRWVVHAAISGISAFIDPHGRIVARTQLFEPAILRRVVPQSTARTPYTRFGDWFPIAALAGVSAGLFLTRRPPRARPPAGERAAPRRVLVIVPTYNERGTIEEVVRRVLAADPRVEVLVVDDGSPDGTGEAVRAMMAAEARISLLERPAKAGLASAYLAGFHQALERGYDAAVEMDADLSHEPEQISRLLEGLERSDLVIGSRYVPGGGVTNWNRARRTLSRGGNAYARIALGFPLTDATSGFRAYRRDLLEDLANSGISSDGYAFQIELAYRAYRAGYAVAEVPITFREREHGHSKMSRRIVAEAMWRVAGWGVRDRLRRGRAIADPIGSERPDQPER